ncbi:acriflavin resistance protein [Niastella yeongjuensis]|uniref:Acriflavin resistance protein n=1 Tax=Niastella yeongjuensis TaxID=354355 RepID=A0A1V9ES64_9BACT|nr:efflux RND transporter permease subunit [Niastella yeongjuensis]OQP48970.1 acriflavin resistance protein [Niastella yeongjuensis]SEP09288.1 hydrophobic/amphiphilic exporter-1, HAE1 family [Niastella yeongjuensis]
MSLTELSIKRPTLIVVIFTVLGLIGIVSYFSIGYELLPKMSKQIITISTKYPGAAPSEVENSVTKEIEDAVSSLEKLDNIKSKSLEGQSNVIVEFKADVDIDQAMQDAQRKVNAIASQLPEDAKDPVISKFSVDEAPIMKMSVAAKTDNRALYDVVKQRIVPLLSKLAGVANIGIMGGEERQIRVNIDRTKVERYGLDVQQVLKAIETSNLDFPAGSVKNIQGETTIRLAGKFKNPKDIEAVVITERDGKAIHLSDVAVVIDGIKETETVSRYNANTAIGLLVYKQTDANAVQVSRQMHEAIRSLEKEYKADGLTFAVAQDSSEFTMKAAEAVNHDLMLAILLVALVMLVFLHSLRNAVIVMIAIPASLVSTFIGIHLFGFTFNLMTLLALSLVVGILVDDSIVVLENIQRHMEMGKDKRKAALEGRNEIGFTAMSITLVDVVVFLPITMVDGMIADILRQFSMVVVVSTLMSLFVCFTLTPLLVSRFGKLTHPSRKRLGGRIILWVEKKINLLTDNYTMLLKWSLGHKRWVLGITLALLVGSFSLVGGGFIGNEFVNMGDRGELVVKVEMPKDATIEQTNMKTQEVERFILTKKEVVNVFSSMGKSDNQFAAQGERHIAEVSVKLVDKGDRSISTEKFSQNIKKELQERITGAKIRIANVDIMGSTSEAPIQVVLSGSKVDQLLAYADTVLQKMKTVPGAADAKISIENDKPEVSIRIDKEKMMALGLRMDQVGNTVKLAFNGNSDAQLSEGQYDYDITVKLDAFDRESVNDLQQLSFVNGAGEIIRLNQFATIEKTIGPAKLERKDRISSVTVSCEVTGRPQGTVGAEIKAAIEKDPIPGGIAIEYEGNMKQQAEAFGSMGYALIASIIFVYLIMVALYNSYIYPFVVLFSIPVAIVGALLALALAMQSLNIFSLLGIIMLIGLVAKNAILLVDCANHLKQQGMGTIEALIESGRTRLRPILMTTIAMVIGMLPLALASGAGAEWKNGMAWALIGGLTSSMLLTLVVVPSIYLIIDRLIARFSRKPKTALSLATA